MQYLHFLFRLWSYWHVVGSAGSIFSKTLHSKASISALFALATLGLTWFFYIESTGNWCSYAIYRKIAIDATLQSFQKFSCVTAALSVALKLLPLPHKSHKSWLHFFSIIFAVLKLWPYFHLFFFLVREKRLHSQLVSLCNYFKSATCARNDICGNLKKKTKKSQRSQRLPF